MQRCGAEDISRHTHFIQHKYDGCLVWWYYIREYRPIIYYPTSKSKPQEYFQQTNGFGLGTLSADGSTFTPNTDFSNLKSQYLSVSPTAQSSSSYTPTISLPVTCPPSNASWPVSTAIPPTPNSAVCSCVVGNLTCTSTLTDADLAQVGTAINTVCAQQGASAGCAAISGNGTTGVYGALSFCDPVQALDIALDAYYEGQGRVATACAFGGVGTVGSGGPTATSAVASATSQCLKAGFSSETGLPSGTVTPSGAFTSGAASPTSSSGSAKKTGASEGIAGMRPEVVVLSFICVGAAMVLNV